MLEHDFKELRIVSNLIFLVTHCAEPDIRPAVDLSEPVDFLRRPAFSDLKYPTNKMTRDLNVERKVGDKF